MNLKNPITVPQLTAPSGYRAQAEDCSLEADLLDFYLLRQISNTDRVAMTASLIQGARKLSLHCLRRRFAHLSAPQFARRLAEAWLQEDCPPDYIPTGSEMTWIQDSTQLAAQLHQLLTQAQIPYYITGGVAAITYGEPRTTRDLDMVLSIAPNDIERLASILEQAGFYVPGVEDVKSGRMRTLQITQMSSISRADLVIAATDSYEQLKFQRRQLCPFPDGTEVYLASPEDVVINKLRWGERSQSEKQWRDVLGVMKVQQEALDYEEMYFWAAGFSLSESLEQATIEAGVQTIAGQQWAMFNLATINAAYQIAQQNQRVHRVAENLEIVEGSLYVLVRDTTVQTLTVNSRGEGRQVAQFDFEGNVLMAQPTLFDRQQWREIAGRIAELRQQQERGDRQTGELER
jgi:hypothetical protein